MNATDRQLDLFKVTMEQRMYEASKFWAMAEEEYHLVQDFTSSFNALLQSLRNITFILQSNKKLITGFDEWYTKKQEDMKADPFLRWLVESRNIVVKQENLKLKSKTKVDLYNWEKHPVMEIIVDPLENTETIRKSVLADIGMEVLTEKLRQPLLRIEREWVADNLPEKELLSLTAYCYQSLKAVVLESFEIAGIDKKKIINDFEKNSLILTTQSTFLNNRTVVLDPITKKKFSLTEVTVRRDSSTDKIVQKRYGVITPIKKGDGLRGLLELADSNSRRIMTVDGYHIPTALLYNNSESSGIYAFPVRDRSEIYLAIRNLADRIILDKDVSGVVLVVEMWLKSFDLKIKGEALIVAMISNEESEVRYTPFSRAGKPEKITFAQTKLVEIADIAFLDPIVKSLAGR